ISFFTFDKVSFTSDISQLNYIPDDIRAAEKSLEESTSLTSKSLYVVSHGTNIEQVLEANSNLADQLAAKRNDGAILDYTSSGELLQSSNQQQLKIDRWNSFWNPQRKSDLRQNLTSASTKLGFNQTAYQPFYEMLDSSFGKLDVEDFLAVEMFSLSEFFAEKNGFITISTLVKVGANQRESLIAELESDKVTVIDRQNVNETFLNQLKTDFSTLINLSIIAVMLILYVFFRRIELVLISTIPILVTGLVTAGIMGITGLELNIFSTIVCTLIFGHGVDFSIFMTSALQKELTYGDSDFSTYRTSIILAVVTTLLAIGALIFAEHPALKSISGTSLIGVFAALVITFVFYPMLFRFFFTKRVANGNSPFELRTLIHSSLSFTYYGGGGFLLSLISTVMIKILPLKKEKKIRMFHTVMSKFMMSVLYSNWYLKKKIVNEHSENFEKPAVIIANHASFLDILSMGMLNPKIIFLVSDWVYNSPIFGKGVRLAGFYPVSQGIEGSIEHLREKVEMGYSLMVFPEGSRSEDNHIRRFHKGAFYLAEQFNLDILPVVIHGTAEVLPKGDFIINDGPLTLTILPRISAGDQSFGNDYSARTKNIGAYFRNEYAKIRHKIEGPNYFKKLIIGSFAYRERSIVKTVRENLDRKLEFYYDNQIGAKARILHLANDYGETDALLAMQHPQRKIHSFIQCDENRKVARANHITIKKGVIFPDTIEDVADREFDVLIISTNPANVDPVFIRKFKQVIIER
ncbi:MAG: 1-acyl-sn-glycerol-3-phosphate acyltransferase, partial [Flavobacterium sp.]|nr:1-acyl-sn-glycerol-3-phosphate acyltransferase [Flavobacterium sp.]